MKAQPGLEAFQTRLGAPLSLPVSLACALASVCVLCCSRVLMFCCCVLRVLLIWLRACARPDAVGTGCTVCKSVPSCVFACPSTGACSFFLHTACSYNQLLCVCVCVGVFTYVCLIS